MTKPKTQDGHLEFAGQNAGGEVGDSYRPTSTAECEKVSGMKRS